MRYLAIVAVFFLVAWGCKSRKPEGPSPDTATSGTMEFIADEALQPALDSLVAGFNAEHPDAKVSVRYLPATEALDAMLQKRSRLVIIGRALNVKELESLRGQHIELFDFDIALNAVACIASSASGRTVLPFAELRDNIVGTKSAYGQALGSHLSSTEAALDSIFLADTATLKGKVIRFSTADSVIRYLKSDANAIGYLSSAWLKQLRRDSALRVLDVAVSDSLASGGLKPVMLHLAYIYQGKYPLVSRVMGYTMEPPNTLPRGFLAYAMSPNGQRVFLDHDLLPRTQIIRLVPAK